MNTSNQEYLCHCGHVFAQSGHLICHQRTCRATNVLLVDALAKAKDLLKAKKRRRLENLVKHAASSTSVSNAACHRCHEHEPLPSAFQSANNPREQLGANINVEHEAHAAVESSSSSSAPLVSHTVFMWFIIR